MMDDAQYINQHLTREKTPADYINAFMRRKYKFSIVVFIMLIIVVLVSLLLPAIYKSSAIILIEQQEIPQDLVRTTVTSYADQRVQTISQRVMTTTNMKAIIDKYNLYVDERKKEPMEVILSEMRDDISLDMISADVVDPRTGMPSKATIAFSLSYLNDSAKLAQKVANEFVSLFLNENLKNRTEMAEEANEFLQDEVNKLSDKVNELEEKLANFKEENSGSLPEMVNLNLELMDRQERELTEVKRQIQTLKERKIYLESELSQLKPSLGNISETGERIMGPHDRLKILETRLISLTSSYSEEHPDVAKLKKEIVALENEVGINNSKKEIAVRLKETRLALDSLKEKYSDEHPEVRKLTRQVKSLELEMQREVIDSKKSIYKEVPDNPAYIQIQAQLEAVTSELTSYRDKETDINKKLKLYEDRLIKSPEVEREYRSLVREYENEVAKFREIKAKQMEAQLAENLESEKKGERFTLIEPPLLPEKPDSPNRLAIFFVGLIASIAAGLGSVLLLDSLDQGVYGRRGVEKLLGELPLTVIPYIETSRERKRRYMKYILVITFTILFFVLAIAAIHFFYKPLDVLQYTVMRKIGFI